MSFYRSGKVRGFPKVAIISYLSERNYDTTLHNKCYNTVLLGNKELQFFGIIDELFLTAMEVGVLMAQKETVI